jgi:cation:H+ antiporter
MIWLTPEFLATAGIALAVVLLIQSGKVVVRALSQLARRLGLSEYVLSFVLLAFATSLPEFSVGMNAALSGVPALSLGDIIGTNVVNTTLIMGLVAIIGRTVMVRDYDHFKSNRIFEFLIVLSPLLFLLDGRLGRGEALILLVFFVWNLFRLLDIDDKIFGRKVLRPHLSDSAHVSTGPAVGLPRLALTLFVGAAVLISATVIIVGSAQQLALSWGISEVIIGLLIIATATSLPELTIGIRSVTQAKGGLALGDIMGAAAINSTFTLAIVALIEPIVITDTTIIWKSLGFTAVAFLLLFYFLHTKRALSRGEGVVLCAWYGLFVLAQLWW